ncbi:adenosylcobinamide amidohydrolase [Leptospira borgpetersenii]|uniref:Adenosylcobinamide amidohydrolase n=3 Tax=Leptospira borgpetersenii TaxID=174 RepID=A0A0S2IXN5_LEPBO|nr:adenosylcobinamide amidohydrolase [Leptospira borgpetersenii]EMO10031.1 adenosylcobinamide amidohydrolase [Leptospira borgpetersenii str. Noumea 25]ALO28393.1 adenosylcobinamide amidohydrolase [Leptospira borgpetersenii serovar Ballum]ANH02462.1 Adenosylcobinamide amidohydrolase [Leptospira borgpetersenii str. 4E]AXX17440.1 adenosylcobinamide amidohydrolase [Leptospira borgpetersenii serovar Ceylonica]EKR00988.1 adenosylcobinamide amidohydrolase [Leptospira borgpetersenii serovar Castelloni
MIHTPLITNDSTSWLIANFEEPHNVLSWAVIGGGWTKQVDCVLWHRVRNEDLTPDINPTDYFRKRLFQKEESRNVVGFLTSVSLENYSEVILQKEDLRIRSIVTAGLGNSVRIGDRPSQLKTYGTINILVQCSAPMNLNTSLEAVSLIAEARTLAVLEAKILSKAGQNLATGTGTDCIAFASPSRNSTIHYTGKHTLSGHLIGKAVHESVSQGITNWKENKLEIRAGI